MLQIETKTFFMLVATLAAGGGAGYVASEKHVLPPLSPPPPPPEPVKPEPKLVVSAVASVSAAPVPTTPAAPPCDDLVGAAGDCPPMGLPTIEGGCGSFATTRCGEFKSAMKPRVASSAVTCLQKLTPQERCDPKRVILCGHTALMNACAEPEMASGSLTAAPSPTSVAAMCRTIVAGCGAASVVPSLVDCERTLAGMTAVGREQMTTCLRKHCGDRGLLYCEATADTK